MAKDLFALFLAAFAVVCGSGGDVSGCVRVWPRRAAGPAQRLAQDELDLRVEAAQIIVRPALHRVEHGAVDPQEERLPLRHGTTGGSFRY